MSAKHLSQEQIDFLLKQAYLAGERAYVPHSNFRVGAAVLTEDGQVYKGANIENDSYGLALCAERVALSVVKMASDSKIIGIAVACLDANKEADLRLGSPCGPCRQWMLQLAEDADIIIAGSNKIWRIDDLLPMGFKLPRC